MQLRLRFQAPRPTTCFRSRIEKHEVFFWCTGPLIQDTLKSSDSLKFKVYQKTRQWDHNPLEPEDIRGQAYIPGLEQRLLSTALVLVSRCIA